MRYKLPLVAVVLGILLASSGAILYVSSRASAEDPAGIGSSPPAAPYACLTSQEEYDSCVAAGRVPVDDPACPSFPKFLYGECIAYASILCSRAYCTEWTGSDCTGEWVFVANTADSYCWTTPDNKTIATSMCDSGWACPQAQTPYTDEQTCIASTGVVAEDPLCLTGKTCQFYQNASVACRDLEFGECVQNEAQVASCAAIGGTRVQDVNCWRDSQEYDSFYTCICLGTIPPCGWGDEGECQYFQSRGVVKEDDEHCGSVGGIACYTHSAVQDKCVSAAPVGGEAQYPELEPAAATSANHSSSPNAFALGGLAAGGALLLTAGGWYARRRWHPR